MIDYVKADVYEDYLITNIKNRRYSLVKALDVINVLEKLKIDIGIFSKASDKAKRKNIETVIKALKG